MDNEFVFQPIMLFLTCRGCGHGNYIVIVNDLVFESVQEKDLFEWFQFC